MKIITAMFISMLIGIVSNFLPRSIVAGMLTLAVYVAIVMAWYL